MKMRIFAPNFKFSYPSRGEKGKYWEDKNGKHVVIYSDLADRSFVLWENGKIINYKGDFKSIQSAINNGRWIELKRLNWSKKKKNIG